MKKVAFFILFSCIFLGFSLHSVYAAFAPAQVSGYIYPPGCIKVKHPKFVTNYNFVGQPLNVYMSNKLAATTIINKMNYFSVSIPMTATQDFATFVANNTSLGGILIHPGDTITANLCGLMPLIPIKPHKK